VLQPVPVQPAEQVVQEVAEDQWPVQAQMALEPETLHVPPFPQGFGKQGSSVLQDEPIQPVEQTEQLVVGFQWLVQVHTAVEPETLQDPPLAQVTDAQGLT